MKKIKVCLCVVCAVYVSCMCLLSFRAWSGADEVLEMKKAIYITKEQKTGV